VSARPLPPARRGCAHRWYAHRWYAHHRQCAPAAVAPTSAFVIMTLVSAWLHQSRDHAADSMITLWAGGGPRRWSWGRCTP